MAGHICLDFVNTGIGDGRVTSYQELVDWARVAGALDPGEAAFARDRWAGDAEGAAALARALTFRTRLFELAEAFLRGQSRPPAAAVDSINDLLKSRPGHLQLLPAGGEWRARWQVPLRRADDVLWLVARSAAALVAEDDWSLVRRCARASCGLFFFDGTKNRRKRYCRMDVCGSAERAAAYYRRRRS